MSDQCPARYPSIYGPGHWRQIPLSKHGDDPHHDLVEWAGPWVRWCDDPESCERPDCNVSAYNVRLHEWLRKTAPQPTDE